MKHGNSSDASCSGKRTYPTFAEAANHAKHARRGRFKRSATPYHCQFCRQYHVGSPDFQSKKRRQEKRELSWEERLEFLDA